MVSIPSIANRCVLEMSFIQGTALSVKDVFEFAGAIIVVVGVPVAFYQANSRWATRHLSDSAMDKDEMGYFVTEVGPLWQTVLWLLGPFFGRLLGWLIRWLFGVFYIPTVEVPGVPSVGTLIRAGDDGVISSAMLGGTTSKDPNVSWVPVYESFFREYEWCMDRRDFPNSGPQDSKWKGIVSGKDMKIYREQAAFDVWTLKHRAADGLLFRYSSWKYILALKAWYIYYVSIPLSMACE